MASPELFSSSTPQLNKSESPQLPFSTPGHYLLFRAIRFPSQINPYALHAESFFQTELRKISRSIGKKTRIYEMSNKTGNQKRSMTLMTPGQKLFGCVGYGCYQQDVVNMYHFARNMNDVATGYGKLRQYGRFSDMQLPMDQRLNAYPLQPAPLRVTMINECIMDIGIADIQFFYYSAGPLKILDRGGLEPISLSYRLLSVLYMQNEWKRFTQKDCPIYEYSLENETLKKKEFSKECIQRLLSQYLKVQKNNPHILQLLLSFSDDVKDNKELLSKVHRKLSSQLIGFKFGRFNTSHQAVFSHFESFMNKAIFKINCYYTLAKTLHTYQRFDDATYVAKATLAEIIKNYSDPRHPIYEIKKNCRHPDIHIRNFCNLIESIRELLPEASFIEMLASIQRTFKIVKSTHDTTKKVSEDATSPWDTLQHKDASSLPRLHP